MIPNLSAFPKPGKMLEKLGVTGGTGATSAGLLLADFNQAGIKTCSRASGAPRGASAPRGNVQETGKAAQKSIRRNLHLPLGNQMEKNREKVMGYRYRDNIKSQPYCAPGPPLTPLLVFFVGKCNFTHFGADCCSSCPESWTCSANLPLAMEL